MIHERNGERDEPRGAALRRNVKGTEKLLGCEKRPPYESARSWCMAAADQALAGPIAGWAFR
jgi:hypothetical protein